MIRLVRDWFTAFFWRRKVQQNFRQLAGPGDALDCDVDALWQRIALQLEPEMRRRPLPMTARRRLHLAMAAAAAILLLGLPFRFASRPEPGVKAPQLTPVLSPSMLSFAILKNDGTIQRGHAGARLKPGEAVIFHVETPGLSDDTAFQLDIFAEAPGEHQEQVVDQYRVTAAAETLKGTVGSILYEPEAPGVYRFYGFRTFRGSRDAVAGFTVEKLP